MSDQQMYALAGLVCVVPHLHPRVSVVLGAMFLCLALVSW